MQKFNILRKVRKNFDYMTYCEENFPVKYVPNGEIRICCFMCDDYKYKLYVNDEKKIFNCFKCGFSNRSKDVFDFVAQSSGISRGNAIMKLSHEYAEPVKEWDDIIEICKGNPVQVEEDVPNQKVPPRVIEMPREAKLLESGKGDQTLFWQYLRDRGLRGAEIRAIKTHYVSQKSCAVKDSNDKYRGNIGMRVIVPVYGPNHKLASWVARSVDGREPKYLTAPESDANKVLWPAVTPLKDSVVLVEGILDSLAVRRLGMDSYATLGKKVSLDQIEILKHYGVIYVTLFWDKRDAIREMIRAIDILKMHFKVFVPDFSSWPNDKDAGDTLADEDLSDRMRAMLMDKLIEVDSWDYVLWKTEV